MFGRAANPNIQCGGSTEIPITNKMLLYISLLSISFISLRLQSSLDGQYHFRDKFRYSVTSSK